MLTINNLSAQKGGFALKSLNFTVNEGEIVGLIGRNGSGKTTLMQCISGQYPLSGGSFTVFGKKLWELNEEEYENTELLDSSGNTFRVYNRGNRLLKCLKQQFANFDADKFRSLYERMGLDINKKTAEFSLGQYEMFRFAVAIAHGAKLILVDETLSGLDPISKELLFEILREYAGEGAGMLITSHNISDLDRLCDRLIFIDDGKMLLEASPDELKEEYSVIEVSRENLEDITDEAIIYKKYQELSVSLLVRKKLVNPAYINRQSTLEEIVTGLLKSMKEV